MSCVNNTNEIYQDDNGTIIVRIGIHSYRFNESDLEGITLPFAQESEEDEEDEEPVE